MNSGSAATPSLPPTENPYEVLRNRDFVFYLVARFIASIGSQMLVVAVGWELYERTHQALSLGLVGLTKIAPMILLVLPAGYVAESFNRKRTILLTILLTVFSTLGLAFISYEKAQVGWVYVCLAAAGVAQTFLWPASQSFLPQLVSRKNFPRAVTWNTGAFHLSSVIGPAAGGALIALTKSPAWVYVITAFCTLGCFVLVTFVKSHHLAKARETITVSSLFAGFNFVYHNKIIFGIITLDLFAVLLGGATALLPVYAKDILHVGPEGLGALEAGLPLGSICCSLYLAHRKPMQKAGSALVASVTIFGLATVVFGFSQWFWLSFAMLVICGMADNVSVIIRHTLVQLLTPDSMRGRVSAVNSLFIGTSNELGGFESGFVAHFLGPIVAVVSGGIGTVVVVIATALIWPQIRKYGRLDGTTEDVPAVK